MCRGVGLVAGLGDAGKIASDLLRALRGLLPLRAISWVAVPCSSTALAMVVAISLISPIVSLMPLIATTA